jgi:acetyl esterase/lipase
MVLALAVNSCAKPLPAISLPAETIDNVAYGTDPKHKMDIYLPQNRSAERTKLIVLIHGGGWNGGDKGEFTPYITELQKRLPDYAYANINYRLCNLNSGNNRFPAQENDVKTAIEFLRAKSAEYKVSHSIILLGASAGAHLALLQGYKIEKPQKVKAVISFFGPSDLVDLYNHPANPSIPLLLNAVTGSSPSQNKLIYEQSSPINFVTAQSPPTLILHGGRDFLVPEKQSTLLKNKLESLRVIHQYVYYPNEGHGWRGNSLFDSLDKIATFLRQNII